MILKVLAFQDRQIWKSSSTFFGEKFQFVNDVFVPENVLFVYDVRWQQNSSTR
jgi:hypothetical protein